LSPIDSIQCSLWLIVVHWRCKVFLHMHYTIIG
jgi:hypothetical protein